VDDACDPDISNPPEPTMVQQRALTGDQTQTPGIIQAGTQPTAASPPAAQMSSQSVRLTGVLGSATPVSRSGQNALPASGRPSLLYVNWLAVLATGLSVTIAGTMLWRLARQ
jgi:hypothetical protein